MYIIAEIGINHNGDLNIAKRLIDVAYKSGCDAVKFQKRTIEKVYSKEELDKPRESPWGTTNRQQKNGLEFKEQHYDIIDKYCKEKKIDWFASSWDEDSQEFLKKYNLKFNKIASAMIKNFPLMEKVAKEKKHCFISTGMSELVDIDKAVEIFKKHNCSFELMHCNSTYPAKDEEINLNCIKSLKERYNCNIGYSGHENGIAISMAASVFGISSLERHITLDRTMYGTDQSASLEENGLKTLVSSVRKISKALGDGKKRFYESEKIVAEKLRKNLK